MHIYCRFFFVFIVQSNKTKVIPTMVPRKYFTELELIVFVVHCVCVCVFYDDCCSG